MQRLTTKDRRQLELAKARDVLRAAVRNHPGDLHGQLAFFFSNHQLPAALGRKRSISLASETKYVITMRLALKALESKGIRPPELTAVTLKHLRICMSVWEEAGLSSSSLSNRFTVLRRFYGWIGKDSRIGSVAEFVKDPARVRRTYSATEPKGWEARGVSLSQALGAVHTRCDLTALQLELCWAFGLRAQEAVALKPSESDMNTHLAVTRGAKGGRGRHVEITSERQREVLHRVKQWVNANNPTGFLRRQGDSLQRARNHFYYVLRQEGVTKASLGVTAHGLRHQFAVETFRGVSGTPAPVVGGAAIDQATDQATRKYVTEALGHSRTNITTAYTGSVRNITRIQREAINTLLAQLEAPTAPLASWYRERVAEVAASGLELGVFVCGPQADGLPVPPTIPLVLGVSLASESPSALTEQQSNALLMQLQIQLQPIAQKQLGRACLIQPLALVPTEMSRLELLIRAIPTAYTTSEN